MSRFRLAVGLAVGVGIALAVVFLAPEPPSGAPSGAPESLGPADGHDLPGLDTGRVAVGDLPPDFTLLSRHDGPVILSDFRGEKEVVLVFYRGHW